MTNAADTTSTISLFHAAMTRLSNITMSFDRSADRLVRILAGKWDIIGDALLGVSLRYTRSQADIRAAEEACRAAAAHISTMHLKSDEIMEAAVDFRNGLFIVIDRCRAQLA